MTANYKVILKTGEEFSCDTIAQVMLWLRSKHPRHVMLGWHWTPGIETCGVVNDKMQLIGTVKHKL